MKILVHDYSGHAFTVQLARWFAVQGHDVEYWYSADIESPRGSLDPHVDDPENLRIVGITQGSALAKYSVLTRLRQEYSYGRRAALLTKKFCPDIVLSNAPPAVQNALRKATQASGGGFLYWLQDIYSAALAQLLIDKFLGVGGLIGRFAQIFEYSVLRRSDRVICISEDFVPHCVRYGVAAERCLVIGNWAPLDEMPVLSKQNDWSRAHGFDDKFVFLFSGTLGLKHNPKLLSSLAASLQNVADTAVVVITQGMGRNWLEREKKKAGLDNLYLFDFQPHAVLPQVLATGDVLVAILEPFAGELSVPSKILAYLCSGRPLLAALPRSNLAVRVLSAASAGIAVDPCDDAAFLSAARRLYDDENLRRSMSHSGRSYAENEFNLDAIGQNFLDVFRAAIRPIKGRRPLILPRPVPVKNTPPKL